MKDFSELIRAIAALLWPLLTFSIIIIFKKEIQGIFGRLKKGKVFGQEIELSESLSELDRNADSAASSVVSIQKTTQDENGHFANEDDTIEHILSETARSPKVGLMLLATEIERESRLLLAGMGALQNSNRPISLLHAIKIFDQRGSLPRHVASSVESFLKVRNKLVHGKNSDQEDILRAIDSGITILKTLKAIPHEIHTVYNPCVPVYADPLCRRQRQEVNAVILQTISLGGAQISNKAYATTRDHFQQGKRVAWEWNPEKQFEQSWYRDPDTNEIKEAWTSSMEFIGRHIEDI